ELKGRSVPGRVAGGEVVVDGDDVHALAGDAVEVAGQAGDQGLASTGLHLGDAALVQDDGAQDLDVVGAHAEGGRRGRVEGADLGVGRGGKVDLVGGDTLGQAATDVLDGGELVAPTVGGEARGLAPGGVDGVPHADAAVGGLAGQGEGLDQ